MDINNMKNIVVLKNLPSNMVEEAFVILKGNVKVHKKHLLDNKKSNNEKKECNITNDCVIKEAEMIIQEYIDKIEKKSFENTKLNVQIKQKYKRLKALTLFLGIFSVFCIISIIIR